MKWLLVVTLEKDLHSYCYMVTKLMFKIDYFIKYDVKQLDDPRNSSGQC